jgi:hypothetical protein
MEVRGRDSHNDLRIFMIDSIRPASFAVRKILLAGPTIVRTLD